MSTYNRVVHQFLVEAGVVYLQFPPSLNCQFSGGLDNCQKKGENSLWAQSLNHSTLKAVIYFGSFPKMEIKTPK